MEQDELKTFVCQGCWHQLELKFCIKTEGWCYLCDPAVTNDELLSDTTNFPTNGIK